QKLRFIVNAELKAMPFRMRVSSARDNGADLSVSGRLIEGSYMGPEAIQLCDRSGQWVHSIVTQHAVELPKDWPVVPGHGSTLILTIAKPSSGFELDRSQLVVGLGAVIRNSRRADISTMLDEPTFWAIWMPLHLESEELPEPSLAWGLTSEEVNNAYSECFQSHWASGFWPFVTFELPDRHYAEIEFAASIEHQIRVWIGVQDGPRVLLGYDSGHFSFPTMRIQEVVDLADRMECHPAAPLLLLSGAYLIEDEPFPMDAARRWLRHSPGFQEAYLDAVLSKLAGNVV